MNFEGRHDLADARVKMQRRPDADPRCGLREQLKCQSWDLFVPVQLSDVWLTMDSYWHDDRARDT